MFKRTRRPDGFTLVEMLIVLMIISILIILIIPNLSGKNEEISRKGCLALVTVVQSQIDSYYLDNQKYPDSLESLKEANYITEEQITCPNGDELIYESAGNVKLPVEYEK